MEKATRLPVDRARSTNERPPLLSEAGRELLRQRIYLLARVALVLGLVVETLMIGLWALGGRDTPMAAWKVIGHLFVLLGFAAIAWRTRAEARPARELEILDVAVIVLPIGFFSFGLWDAPVQARPALLLVFAATNLLILRAVLVPSTGRRTAIVGVAFTVLVAAWVYVFRSSHPHSGEDAPWVTSIHMGALVVLGVIISTVASCTIFGLRQAVRRASQLGQYTLVRKLGEGGMGVVWEAKHAFLRRRTAVKLLPADRAGEEAIARFEREVQLTSTLTHPNTIAIYDYGRTADGIFYYAMEHLDGIDLQALVDRDGPQSPAVVAHVLGQMCDALAEAHGVGLIHRDVKPANVILCERGGVPLVAKVVDFGLVKPLSRRTPHPAVSRQNAIVGTPFYMAPEAVLDPDHVDARSDLYSVGAVGYYLLTGKPVFDGPSPIEVFTQLLQREPATPSERLGRPVPADIEAVVLACLAKDPRRRPASASEVSAQLAATEAGRGLDADTVQATWQRVRDLAGRTSVLPEHRPTRMTVDLGQRGR